MLSTIVFNSSNACSGLSSLSGPSCTLKSTMIEPGDTLSIVILSFDIPIRTDISLINKVVHIVLKWLPAVPMLENSKSSVIREPMLGLVLSTGGPPNSQPSISGLCTQYVATSMLSSQERQEAMSALQQ